MLQTETYTSRKKDDQLSVIRKILHKKYNTDETKYNKILITNLMMNKNSHYVATYKNYLITDFVDEYLKRFYSFEECFDRLIQMYTYYKNYHSFFGYPTFCDVSLSKMIHNNGEIKAELYYKCNYPNAKQLSKKQSTKTFFNTSTKGEIEKDCLAVISNRKYTDHLELPSSLSHYSKLMSSRRKDNSICQILSSFDNVIDQPILVDMTSRTKTESSSTDEKVLTNKVQNTMNSKISDMVNLYKKPSIAKTMEKVPYIKLVPKPGKDNITRYTSQPQKAVKIVKPKKYLSNTNNSNNSNIQVSNFLNKYTVSKAIKNVDITPKIRVINNSNINIGKLNLVKNEKSSLLKVSKLDSISKLSYRPKIIGKIVNNY